MRLSQSAITCRIIRPKDVILLFLSKNYFTFLEIRVSYVVHDLTRNFSREIYGRYRASYNKGKVDIHTRLMRKYEDIPSWWFYLLLLVTVVISMILCTVLKDQIQLPWWGLLFACAMAFVFTLPISIITATTNQVRIIYFILYFNF